MVVTSFKLLQILRGGPVPAMLPFARLPSAPRSSVQGLPLTCTQPFTTRYVEPGLRRVNESG